MLHFVYQECAFKIHARAYLPRLIGLALEKEIDALSYVIRQPARPVVVIIGGAKVSSKVKVANKLINIADHTLFGGKVVNEILTVKVDQQ